MSHGSPSLEAEVQSGIQSRGLRLLLLLFGENIHQRGELLQGAHHGIAMALIAIALIAIFSWIVSERFLLAVVLGENIWSHLCLQIAHFGSRFSPRQQLLHLLQIGSWDSCL